MTVNVKHGGTLNGTKSPEYNAWSAMIMRCENPKNPRYKAYGGRGITVCELWRKDFAAFLADMGPRPSKKHSLERSNNDLGYSRSNCKWALPHEQMTNRRNTHRVQVGGNMVPVATLAKQNGIPANTLRARILKNWPMDMALSKPVRQKLPNGTGL